MNNGLDISGSQKRDQIAKDQLIESSKQNLVNGIYTPIEYIYALQSTLNTKPILSACHDDIESDNVSIISQDGDPRNICCVCLQPRENTVCFCPCSHASVCFRCDQILMETNETFSGLQARNSS